MITNLVTNAIKHAPNSEMLDIYSQITDKLLINSVVDFGIGIADNQKQYLFERFHQI